MTETEMLSDEELAEIEAQDHTEMCGDALYCDCGKVTRDALCQTVRALRESLRAAVASVKVNDQNQPLDRACPWTLDWYATASAMLNGQSFDPQPQYEKGFEAGTAFAKSAIEDLREQLAQVEKERDNAREMVTMMTTEKQRAEQNATSMRSRCVQKVREMRDDWIKKLDETNDLLWNSWIDAASKIIATLESLPLEQVEQEKR